MGRATRIKRKRRQTTTTKTTTTTTATTTTTTTPTTPKWGEDSDDEYVVSNTGTTGGVTFKGDGARDLFDAKLISQRDEEEGDAREPRKRGRGKHSHIQRRTCGMRSGTSAL